MRANVIDHVCLWLRPLAESQICSVSLERCPREWNEELPKEEHDGEETTRLNNQRAAQTAAMKKSDDHGEETGRRLPSERWRCASNSAT